MLDLIEFHALADCLSLAFTQPTCMGIECYEQSIQVAFGRSEKYSRH